MENSGESISPQVKFIVPSKEVSIITDRQESLNRQLEKLDKTRPDHNLLSKILVDVYGDYKDLDEQSSLSENIRYKARCANKDTVTKTIFGSYEGSYDYKPIVDIINDIPDPYNIFPKLEEIIKKSKDLSNEETIERIAKIITENTDVPVIVESFGNFDESYGQLENGNLYSHMNKGMSKTYGVHEHQYTSNPDVLADLKKQDYSDNFDYDPKGEVILVNKSLTGKPYTISTAVHELGHIIENNFVLNKDQENSEVISSLYGLKVGMMMAEVDFDKAVSISYNPVILYNWILTGTVAP